MKKIILAALLTTLIASFGYCQEAEKKEPKINQVKDGNFVLYVSNQNPAIRLVDIKVYIDGKVAVDQEFSVGNQDAWIPFSFNLSQGSHEIKAESVKGESDLKEKFKTTGKNWAVVEYLDSKQFTFDISDKPIDFEK